MKMSVRMSTLVIAGTCGLLLVGCGGGSGSESTSVEPITDSVEFMAKVEETLTDRQATELIFLSLTRGNSVYDIVAAVLDDGLREDGTLAGIAPPTTALNSPIVSQWLINRSGQDLPDGIPAYMALVGLACSGYTMDQLIDSALDGYTLVKEGNAIYIINDSGTTVEPDEDPQASGISDVNSPPIAYSQSVPETSLAYGGSLNIGLTGKDPNGGTVYFELLTSPGDGSLVKTGNFAEDGKLRYTSASGFTGIDTFTFRTYDEDGAESQPAIVSIKVGMSVGSGDYVGVGTTTVTGNGLTCESEAVWRIVLNPGGTLWGTYSNPEPLVPTLDYSAGRYVCAPWTRCDGCLNEWTFSFNGTYDSGNGTFVIDSFGYFDSTSRAFIDYGTQITGTYDDDKIVTDPAYQGSTIGHSFNIAK